LGQRPAFVWPTLLPLNESCIAVNGCLILRLQLRLNVGLLALRTLRPAQRPQLPTRQ
jgi:hypothetical protein